MIAFTNHALDHLLCNILDAGITTKIARLGSRHSAHERILPYLLENLEKRSDRGLHRWDIGDTRQRLKEVADEFSRVTAALNGTAIDEPALTTWLEQHQPEHNCRLHKPPHWVRIRRTELKGWKTVGDKTRDESIHTYYGLWAKGVDLDFLDPPVTLPRQEPDPPPTKLQQNRYSLLETNEEKSPTSSQPGTYRINLVEWFNKRGFNKIPPVPQGGRSLDMLLCDEDVWNMSRRERSTLCKYWESETRAHNHQSNVMIFEELSQKHAKLQSDLDAYNTEVTSVPSSCVSDYGSLHFQARLELLRELDIIGCTTTGAAKLTGLLKV
jgi:hypothetical protein